MTDLNTYFFKYACEVHVEISANNNNKNNTINNNYNNNRHSLFLKIEIFFLQTTSIHFFIYIYKSTKNETILKFLKTSFETYEPYFLYPQNSEIRTEYE